MIGLVQPGYVPWLQAAGSQRPKDTTRHTAHPTHVAPTLRSAHAAPVTSVRSADAASTPGRRVGSEARYVRRWLQPRLPDLCEAVLRSALGGDMEATRMLLRMSGLDGKTETPKKKPTKTGPGFAKKAIDEFRAR